MKKLILKNFQSPGDVVMLTAAVRDLHRAHPGKFTTDVRSSTPALWENNPYVTPMSESDPDVSIIECQYPLIHSSNAAPFHFIHGFIQHLSGKLGVPIQPTEFRGDIHLSAEEKTWMSQVQEITGTDTPFWIIVAGGKSDFTIKWWHHERWQRVVDHFRKRILFVQVGEKHHHHHPLKGVLDLRGKTDLRQLVRLVYHSRGVLCPVTLLMHLAAAVENRHFRGASRPCIVVAGGREPNHWEAYPGHQFLHTIGMLPCCAGGGCWRSRTVPLGDGDEKDNPGSLCLRLIPQRVAGRKAPALPARKARTPVGPPPVHGLPECMHLIKPEEVIEKLEAYRQGGAISYLTPGEADHLGRVLPNLGWN